MTSGPKDEGPGGPARALGADLLALFRTRAELIGLEIEEGAARRKRMLVLGAVAALFGAVTLLLAALFVVIVFWETHRVAAAAGVTIAYGAVAAWAYAKFSDVARNTPPLFSATLAEFRKDLDMLRGSDEPHA